VQRIYGYREKETIEQLVLVLDFGRARLPNSTIEAGVTERFVRTVGQFGGPRPTKVEDDDKIEDEYDRVFRHYGMHGANRFSLR
jgi:hypothetical protein